MIDVYKRQLITVGKMLEARSKGRTTDALKSLMKLAPKTASVIRDGEEVLVSIDQVTKGDIFIVRPGENIPVDGIVLEGSSAVNEAVSYTHLDVYKRQAYEVKYCIVSTFDSLRMLFTKQLPVEDAVTGPVEMCIRDRCWTESR